MPKRTLFLILFLILTVAGLLALSLNTTPKPTQPSTTATPSPAQTVLTLSKAATSSGQIDVNINTGSNKVTAVQLELEYDPESLTNVDIEPASFFENPVVLLKTINDQDGRISLALGVAAGQSGVTGTGTVANLTYITATSSGQTKIDFLPKTLVSAEGIAQSVLESAFGIIIDFNK